MKKIIIALLLIAQVVTAQNSQKAWDLLLNNKREEARKLFDKDLKAKMGSDIELLILDGMIEHQRGKMLFDEKFVQDLSKFKDGNNYMYSLWYYPFMIGSVSNDGVNDLTYRKIDFLASADAYKNDPHVIYTKATFDRRRLNYAGYNEYIKQLNPIVKWQFCGVFENMNGSGLDTEYEPEYYAKNDKTFNANSNGVVNWYVPQIPQNEGVHFYINEGEYGNGIIYAQTFIESDADREVLLDLGSSGPLKVFVNDVEAFVNDKINTTDLNAFNLKFNLKKGMNRLVIKSSTDGGNDYFFAALTDVSHNQIPSLAFHDSYQPYTQATPADVNALEVNPAFEEFLSQKVKSSPEKAIYKILLFDAYMNNHKAEKAHDAIKDLWEKYPGSSMLALKMIQYYTIMEDDQKVEELVKSVMVNDEDYFYSIIKKTQEDNWIEESNINELERYRDKAKKLQSEHFGILYDYFIALRNSDVDLVIKKMEEILDKSYHNELFTSSFSQLYTSLKNDKAKTIGILEDLVSKRENVSAQNSLINYYNSTGRKDDAKKIVATRIEHYPYFNYVYDDAVEFANNENNYEESLKYTDIGLKNFPYSFKLMEQKGREYNYLKKTAEAEKAFKQSLIYNSSNTSLRKTMYDITKVPDEIEQVSTKDIYTLIKQRRNSKMHSDYGVNVLLDEYIVNIFPEGGKKAKTTYLYEVIAESGIDELKEYEIGGNHLNIIKAEIVKPDGSIVPGEKNYDTVVFTNLKVNDVVYLEYETADNGYGRFYKDFNIAYYFNGVYPSQQTIFGIIHPADTKFAFDITNGNVPSKTKNLNGRTYISWEQKNIPVMPLYEDFSPNYTDLANQIRVSSIKSWADISNWYADLVKKNMKMDYVSIKTYDEIFPQGATGLSQEEIAYRIYKYIGENITYSSLDFRQSGYVPQKPSKTISTKLGDCKDLSTLFVAMAQRAGLKANLVLVQTNDNGIEALKLPAISFNHCIVKVAIDGKEYFLEMTNNYLPFKAMPLSLYKAKALVISFDKSENEKSGLINLPFDNALKNVAQTQTIVTIEDNVKKYTNTHTIKGGNKSYYNELFSAATTEDYRKKEFEEDINNRLNKVISLESVKLISNERFKDEIKYETKFSISEKLQSVGSLKILEVPYIDKIYTRDIISNENRNYDIDYSSFEHVNEYDTEVILNIAEGKKFSEVPESRDIAYKNHLYKIKYELLSPNSLKVTRQVITPWDNIKTTEYAAFKKFVEEVIAAEEEIIGFK
jgi:predicted Zn-dependent protease